jgi:ATP dependent DNA ligase domain
MLVRGWRSARGCFVANSPTVAYLRPMYEFCISSRGTQVPAGPEWYHEIKFDDFGMLVQRDGDRVRLITRGGYDWTKCYPWIVEAALKNRHKQFVIDGEAVILGVDGYSDFNALHSGNHNEEVFAPLMRWRWMATTCGICRSRCARPILAATRAATGRGSRICGPQCSRVSSSCAQDSDGLPGCGLLERRPLVQNLWSMHFMQLSGHTSRRPVIAKSLGPAARAGRRGVMGRRRQLSIANLNVTPIFSRRDEPNCWQEIARPSLDRVLLPARSLAPPPLEWIGGGLGDSRTHQGRSPFGPHASGPLSLELFSQSRIDLLWTPRGKAEREDTPQR